MSAVLNQHSRAFAIDLAVVLSIATNFKKFEAGTDVTSKEYASGKRIGYRVLDGSHWAVAEAFELL